MQRTSISDLVDLLHALGISRGDTVVAHTALFSLGRIEKGLDGLAEAFGRVIGPEGTLIAPTFTYSFRRSEVFDLLHSPTLKQVGLFGEYLRTRPDTVRSACPQFSFAALGPDAELTMRRTSPACFGAGSVFAGLFEQNVIFVGLGITYSNGLPAFMHLEHLAGVDYRYDIELMGQSIGANGKIYDDRAIHFARATKRYPTGYTDREAMGAELESRGIATARPLGAAQHFALRAQPFADCVLDTLTKDPHAMFIASDTRKTA